MIIRFCTSGIFLSLLCVFFSSNTSNAVEEKHKISPAIVRVQQRCSRDRFGGYLIKKYLVSLIPACVIGSTSGTVCALVDRNLPMLFPFSWVMFYILRNIIVDEFSYDCMSAEIPYNKPVAEAVARISDWLAYLWVVT